MEKRISSYVALHSMIVGFLSLGKKSNGYSTELRTTDLMCLLTIF